MWLKELNIPQRFERRAHAGVHCGPTTFQGSPRHYGENAGSHRTGRLCSRPPRRTRPMLTNALSAKGVASLKDGKHRDGQGLQFEVKGGSRRWPFSYMFAGRQRELGIGKYPAMSLADARAKRAELREAKDRGLDPKSVLAGEAVPDRTVTFRQDMDAFVAHMRGQWVPAHRKLWQQSMER